MSDIIHLPPAQGIWRVLILSRDRDDPLWLIAHVSLAEDIRPAAIQAGRYTDWPAVTAWTAARLGEPVELTPVTDPLVWTIRAARRQP